MVSMEPYSNDEHYIELNTCKILLITCTAAEALHYENLYTHQEKGSSSKVESMTGQEGYLQFNEHFRSLICKAVLLLHKELQIQRGAYLPVVFIC